MTESEQRESLIMQIENLRARIDCSQEDCLMWEEQQRLQYLEGLFDKIYRKGGDDHAGRRSFYHPRYVRGW